MAGEYRVRLTGELGFGTEAGTDALLDRAIAESGDSSVVLDCEDVTFIDSCGIRQLLRVRGDLAAQGRGFAMENLRPMTRRAIEIADLEKYLNVRP